MQDGLLSGPSPDRLTRQFAFGSSLLILGFGAASLFLMLAFERTSYPSLVPVVALVSCFLAARFLGVTPGVLFAFTLLVFLSRTNYFGAFPLDFHKSRFVEIVVLSSGAVLCANWLRLSERQVVHLQTERSSLSDALADVERRQRGFLREVLASATDHRLIICDGAGDLPRPLAGTESATELYLTSSTLFKVRSAIRKAAREAGLADSVADELVIAGSEAALNAVVHGNGGTAEVWADAASGKVQIWVRDQGCGISDDLLHRATLERGYSSAGTLGQGFSLIVSCCRRVYLLTAKTGTTVVIEGERS